MSKAELPRNIPVKPPEINMLTNPIEYNIPGVKRIFPLHNVVNQLNTFIAEGTAIKRLFEPYYPKMSSTKTFTGHTLGASGGIEAVFSILALQHGVIFPNLRLQTPMVDLPFVPEREFIKNVEVKHVLSNSFGFGGNCSSLIFSKVESK